MSEFVWIGEGWEGWKEVVLTEITLGDQWILPKIFTSRARRKWERETPFGSGGIVSKWKLFLKRLQGWFSPGEDETFPSDN